MLCRCLADLVAGSAPPHNVVLLGPRGNGKTALLNWFRTTCAERAVDVVATTPQRIPHHDALVDALAPRGVIAKWFPRKVGVGRMDGTAAEQELEAALAAAGIDEDSRFATLASLNRLGYVWCPPDQVPPVAWSAGIPSLMAYVAEKGRM